MNTESLLEFPCDFPIKVMGHHTDEFHATVVEIIARHTETTPLPGIRASRNNKYMALSFTIKASDREQLDALYHELTASELVLFVL
ncbi:MAG: DUF493 domain-containing protein [Gammaproteobacteria bacterium]|nr:DUF493 domain-containing protein [Gammaproteobacteria bacterium]MDH3767631.1 DUF493 domain-containing protein [Gammaproteobacteria bacterium]